MASSYSGESIGGALSQNSGGSEQQIVTDSRKRRRMISNRESARRSRMRKQKHLDELAAQMSRLGAENGRLSAAVGATAQLYLAVEAENCVLRAQAAELSHRLESLNEIISFVGSGTDSLIGDGSFTMNNNPWWEPTFFATQPMVAPADILMY